MRKAHTHPLDPTHERGGKAADFLRVTRAGPSSMKSERRKPYAAGKVGTASWRMH